MLTADSAVIFLKYIHSPSSSKMSSSGLLMLLLNVSAIWTYISVVRMLLCRLPFLVMSAKLILFSDTAKDLMEYLHSH